MQMVNRNYQMLDTIEIIDTSNNIPSHVCSFNKTSCFTLLNDEQLPHWFKDGFPDLHKLLTQNY